MSLEGMPVHKNNLAIASWLTAFLVSTLGFFFANACGSRLPHERTVRRPQGLAQRLDTSQINFVAVSSGELVNLKQYMESEGREYLLLLFGSRDCAACNEKAMALRDGVIGLHQVFETEPGKHFEIIGVNTDASPLSVTRQFLTAEKFSFVKWSDPKAVRMNDYFTTAGSELGVPLSVMISKEGIAWRFTKDDHINVYDIMAKVEQTLGVSGDARPRVTPTVTPKPTPVLPPPSALGAETPGRLRSVKVQTCEGATKDLGEIFGERTLYFVQAVRGVCDAVCQKNSEELKAAAASCAQSAGEGESVCAAVTLQTGDLDPSTCGELRAAKGGAEFFSEFKTHFDWSYPVTEGAEWPMIPEVGGPLVFAFAQSGKMAFSWEGGLAAGQAVQWAKNYQGSDYAVGPNRTFVSAAGGELKFSAYRQQARYSVVNVFGKLCGGCIEELKAWSAPEGLLSFCAARPGGCQVLAVETGFPDPGQSFEAYFRSLIFGDDLFSGLEKQGIKVPLALDPESPAGDDGMGYLRRFSDGYLIAKFPELGFDPRSVIYDREGKIVGAFRTDPKPGHDPVLEALKVLLEDPK